MAKKTTGEFTQFSLSTENILYEDPNSGTLVSNTAKTLANLDSLVKGLEKTIRSSTGEQGFNVNRNLISVDPTTQIGQVKFNVDKKYEDIVKNAIVNFESKRTDLTGAKSYPLSSSMQVEDLVKLEYTKSNILGSKARNKAVVEADKAGGYAETLSPTAKRPERMKVTLFATPSELANKTDEQIFSESMSQTKSLSSQEKKKRKIAEKEAVDKEVQKYFEEEEKEKKLAEEKRIAEEKKQGSLDKKKERKWLAREARDQEKAEKETEKEKARKEAEAKSNRKKTLAVIGTIGSTLIAIADITRRILTATLARASEARKEAIEARTVGMTAIEARELNTRDVAHGLAKGTTMGAIQDLQTKFGDVTKLDEKAISTLARVMGSGVKNMVESGMGGAEPDVLLHNILNKFFENFRQGKNSLGQTVGQDQAKRELTTVLREVSPQIATIFSTMANDFQQGINAGKFRNYEEYQGLVKDYKMNITEGEFQKFTELGAVVDQLKAKFMNLKDDILVKFGNVVSDLVVKVNNSEIGMGDKEKSLTRAEKIVKNKADSDKALMGMKVAESGVKEELAKQGLTLEQFGASSGAELYTELAGIDVLSISDKEYEEKINKYRKIIDVFRRGQGDEILQAMRTSKAYADAYAITKERSLTKSGKVEHDPTLVTEAGIRVASMELGDTYHQAFVKDLDVTKKENLEEYFATYGAFDATQYSTSDKFIKVLASTANKKLKKEGRLLRIPTEFFGGALKNTEDLKTLNALVKEKFLTDEDLAQAFYQAGVDFNYGATATTMKGSVAEKKREKQDIYAKTTDAYRAFMTEHGSSLAKAYSEGYTVDKAVSIQGTKGSSNLTVTLNLVDPQGKKQTLTTTIHTDMNESINVQKNLDMSVIQ